MKIVAFLLLFFISLFAHEVKWMSANEFKDLKSEKIVLIEVMSKSCHYCKNMDKNVFSDREVVNFIEKNFEPVRFVLYKDEIPSIFSVKMVPTFFFYDTNSKSVIKKVVGSWNKEDFLDFLNSVLKAQK